MSLKRIVIGLLAAHLLCAAPLAMAAGTSMFDTFFDDTFRVTRKPQIVSDKIKDFVVKEMVNWEGKGIILFPSDVDAAMIGDTGVLCTDKFDPNGDELTFTIGGANQTAGCDSLMAAIKSLVKAETDADNLGDVLTVIANAGELAVSDQPNRPANVGFSTLLTQRIWTGTGTTILPWPDDANDIVENKLGPEIEQDGGTDFDAIMWRYQHGLFRDRREADPVVQGWNIDGDGDGYTVGDALQELADVLRIHSNDYTKKGEFVVPRLSVPNIGLWARADDLGLMWIYPTHFTRMKDIEEAGDYPEYNAQGDHLAYPYTYKGNFDFNSIPEGADAIKSPYCSRSAAANGYLCRNVTEPVENCSHPDDESQMDLIRCDQQERITIDGPEICPELTVLFDDDGVKPLWDPADPRFINPDLTPADVAHICDPEKRVMYKDEIESHACYVAFCVAQSHSGHTLVSNRSPNIVSEATSPYLACMRQDPHLGLYAELAQMTPFALPSYMGHKLSQEYEREYCAITGAAPKALAGYCAYRENRRANSPLYTLGATGNSAEDEEKAVKEDQNVYVGDAGTNGLRVSMDQWLPVQRKMVGTMSASIQETANLLGELAKAPLTKTPCPWTGPFPRSASSSAP